MTYLCEKGCLNPAGHPNEFKPKRHQNKGECPYEPKFGTPPVESPPAPAGGGTAPESTPPAPVASKPLVRVRPLQPAAPGVQLTQRRIPDIIREPIPEYWVLDAEGARKAWRLGFGGLYFIIEKGHPYLADYLEYPKDKRPPLPDKSKFDLGIAATNAAADPTSIIVKWPSEILKWAGCESLEEAKAMLDEVEFFALIFDPIITTGGYYADMWMESPKYKRAKEANEAAAKKLLAPPPITLKPSEFREVAVGGGPVLS